MAQLGVNFSSYSLCIEGPFHCFVTVCELIWLFPCEDTLYKLEASLIDMSKPECHICICKEWLCDQIDELSGLVASSWLKGGGVRITHLKNE